MAPVAARLPVVVRLRVAAAVGVPVAHGGDGGGVLCLLVPGQLHPRGAPIVRAASEVTRRLALVPPTHEPAPALLARGKTTTLVAQLLLLPLLLAPGLARCPLL